MNKTATSYVPGVCNINPVEVAYRRKWRNIGLVTAAVTFLLLVVFVSNRWVRLVIFLPLFIGMVGYYQTKHRFCVSYAASGLQNASAGSKTASPVTAEQSKADKLFAGRLKRKALLISLLLTAAALLVPVV